MHDIGKVAIPDSILKKPGKLTLEEFDDMKTHTSIGYSIMRHSNRKIIQSAAIIANEHHEKWNGKGYPRGLAGDDIHIYTTYSIRRFDLDYMWYEYPRNLLLTL